MLFNKKIDSEDNPKDNSNQSKLTLKNIENYLT